MEIGNSIGQPNYHSLPPAGGSPSPKKGENGEEDIDAEERSTPATSYRSAMPFGDSMMVSARAVQETKPVAPKQSVEPDVLFHWLGIVRLGILAIAALAVFTLILMAIQPLLAVLFSLGACLVGDCREWLDFTSAILYACRFPGAVVALGLVVVLGLSLKMKTLSRELPESANELDPLYCLARKASKKKS